MIHLPEGTNLSTDYLGCARALGVVVSELLCDSGVRDDMSPHDRLWPSRGFSGESDEPAPFDLRHMIDIVADDLTRRYKEQNLTLEVRYALDAPRYLVGPDDRIRQVMTKLLRHAAGLATLLGEAPREPAPGRGRVVVDIQGDRCADGCAAMRLRVEVAGPAFSADSTSTSFRSHLLPAFLRIEIPPACPRQDRVEPGLVSTLADCRHLVELMGGRLGALTDPDHGSFVWLAMKLPIDAARPTSGWKP